MKTQNKKSNPNKAQETLAQINAQIEALKQQRVSLAEPLKTRHAELRTELFEVETQIRELDPNFKFTLKLNAEQKIRELISSKGSQTESEIFEALGTHFTKWKLKQTLSKKFEADGNGKYSAKV